MDMPCTCGHDLTLHTESGCRTCQCAKFAHPRGQTFYEVRNASGEVLARQQATLPIRPLEWFEEWKRNTSHLDVGILPSLEVFAFGPPEGCPDGCVEIHGHTRQPMPPRPPLTRDFLLSEISRSLRETCPDRCDDILREVGRRMVPSEPPEIPAQPMWVSDDMLVHLSRR